MAEQGRSLRAFFAVELGEAARREAAVLVRRLAQRAGGDGVRWVRPEAFHVTLRLLGAVAEDRVPRVVREVRAATAHVAGFALRLGALHAFPSLRRARVVVLELAPHEPLVALAAAVEAGVVAAGFAPERRRYRGHLTLGRVRTGRLPALDDRVAPCPFPVCEFRLFHSQLSPQGSIYTSLERIPLANASP